MRVSSSRLLVLGLTIQLLSGCQCSPDTPTDETDAGRADAAHAGQSSSAQMVNSSSDSLPSSSAESSSSSAAVTSSSSAEGSSSSAVEPSSSSSAEPSSTSEAGSSSAAASSSSSARTSSSSARPSSSSSGPVSFCGNALLEPGEECDDGNFTSEDDCKNDCTLNTCGDSVTNPFRELCDDGNLDNGDGCQADCTLTPTCGNNITEPGEDCDDGNTAPGDGCEGNCTITPACAPGLPPATGCPCSPGDSVSCFEFPDPARASRPPCRSGTRTCPPAGHWSTCADQVLPETETCDNVDNNCDGVTDEGVRSACGDCTPNCGHVTGDGTNGFPLPGGTLPAGVDSATTDGVGPGPTGLVLDSTTVELHHLWIANTTEDTVSKMDTRTGKETARYVTFNRNAVVCHAGTRGSGTCSPAGGWKAPGTSTDCFSSTPGAYSYCPSRTAVDYVGNVWVGNRRTAPSATKILALETDCVDRNHDGVIQTSRDVNGDGRIDTTITSGANREFYGEEDECIAFTVVVGQDLTPTSAYYARALAIDAGLTPGDPGNAWVGMYTEGVFFQLNGATGALMRRTPETGGLGNTPYGAVVDSKGSLWFVNGCCGPGGIRRINTTTGLADAVTLTPPGSLGTYGQYGIALDHADRVWLGGYGAAGATDRAFRYTPGTDSWLAVTVPWTTPWPTSGWSGRGVGVDTLGNIWAAFHNGTSSALVRINADSGAVTRILAYSPTRPDNINHIAPPEGTGTPVGVGVDFDGNVWAVDQLGANGVGNAARVYLDPSTHEPAFHPVTGNQVDFFPTGPQPYTYSDFTGLGLRTVTRPTGDYVLDVAPCKTGTAHFERVSFDAGTPAGTSVQVWLRVADSLAALPSQPELGPWRSSPADLQAAPGPVPDGRYVRLTFRLTSTDRSTTPVLRSFEARWVCVAK